MVLTLLAERSKPSGECRINVVKAASPRPSDTLARIDVGDWVSYRLSARNAKSLEMTE